MNLEIVYREMKSTEAIKSHIESKAEKIEKFLTEDEHVRVIVGTEAHGKIHFAEIYWHDKKQSHDFFARKEGDSLYTQIDQIFDAISHQIQKSHDKAVSRKTHRQPLKKVISD